MQEHRRYRGLSNEPLPERTRNGHGLQSNLKNWIKDIGVFLLKHKHFFRLAGEGKVAETGSRTQNAWDEKELKHVEEIFPALGWGKKVQKWKIKPSHVLEEKGKKKTYKFAAGYIFVVT